MTVRTKILLPLRGRVIARSFSVSRPRWEAAPLPARKPVGAFRGGYGFVVYFFFLFAMCYVLCPMMLNDVSCLDPF